jgi:hypothetical protein
MKGKAFLFFLCALLVLPAAAQQILLDKPVRAGELVAFPDLNDENAYYYVVDKPHLATDENGRPQFSFLRYVENVRSGAQEAEIREGEGGGIVHALVSLSVTETQRRDAERELRRLKPGSRLEGPVIFKSGKFGLVSSFINPDGGLSKQVVGLGNAPLLDGEKAAVSMQLTKLGAKILWESFQTSTPDISFTFEMDLEGFRSPKRALIEADFDQIYEHESFGAGIASTYLAAEIKASFDDLQRQGAIKLTQVGEDAQLESLISTAYNKISEMMFQPMGGTGTPDLASLSGAAGGQGGLLDRATTMLAKNREETEKRNAAKRKRAAATEESREERTKRLRKNSADINSQAEKLEKMADEAKAQGMDAEYVALLRKYAEGFRNEAEEAEQEAVEAAEEVEEEEPPAFAIVAAYEMKRVRQRGTFRIDLNKYTSDSLTLRFDENIGDLRRLLADENHFRQVNLDDPLYRQREIVAFVDGLNAGDFGEYINFVTIQMRKKHQGGDETHDEVRVDRNNFNREGNNFKLLYGWKADEDRRLWMDYEYRTTWSFFGGASVEGEWMKTASGAINLAPPYQRREVTLEATDTAALKEAGVRAITVKIYYDLGGGEMARQETLNASKGELSRIIEFMSPENDFDYDYEISWSLRGNRNLSTGRQSASSAILFVDELPGN